MVILTKPLTFSHDPYNIIPQILRPTNIPLIPLQPSSIPLHFVGFCSPRNRKFKPAKTLKTTSSSELINIDKKINVKFVNGGSSSKSFTIYKNDHDDANFVQHLSKEVPMANQFEATLNRLSKWIVTAMFIVCLVWKHDGESLWVAMGSVINYIVCITLKRLLKQERPVFRSSKSDPGMPSSHAQSIFYILTASILSVIESVGENTFTLTISALALACASYLSWLRVSQQFHTRSQVIVGGVVGSIFAIIWFWSWHSFVFEAFIHFWWVRALVLLGASTFFVGYLFYIIHHTFITS